ncbi:hypothetical protein [Cryptosporidium parvum Iowa II]|uniref:Uncharacterized protein n=2 Tax=Cryptosporidium parvum TaxID=5807 RepID=Q5CWC8_CRYPI|nr:hypothetical protein [Cryptosporidium parvum Iowa II]EAK89312.1 hypothetical protein cgd8_820 [Cryptosporidium parvum Iowa II]QOY39832.1 Uncharacterized protein CPATCC_0000860 [Cryptosporidium parvum]WKS79330.1 hypothetical protein CPCDC_8g820 [Cryptosporidium sp. 43IA8]WRK33829.1 Uncharacterized protein cpbgf_800820 [Cryptosporidium parvum]|eukprot:QOY39832.1 hypothetical protein CPATCC_003885 [Cryptosporidium parvum]
MPIMKNRDAAFNYGCLMAELKEKMVLFRNRLNKGEEENQESFLKNNSQDESKIGRDSLISENELDFSLNIESSSKNTLVSDRIIQEDNTEIIVESGIENVDECRIGLSNDSKVFPYPICFVSKSLPTPPKDYNLRKTGIDLNKNRCFQGEDIECNRVSKKLMFLVEKEKNGGKEEWWKFRRENDNDDNYNLLQSQNLGEAIDTEKSFPNNNITNKLMQDDSKNRKANQGELSLTQNIISSQSDTNITAQKGEVIDKNRLLKNSQSIENIRGFEENIPSKMENLKHIQASSVSGLKKDNIASDNATIKNSSEYKINTNTQIICDVNKNGSISRKETQINPIFKKKSQIFQHRGNIITTRYYKMASQLRVIS